jgi:hypothetical protein
MSRCRFVQPEVVRLHLVDVHRRALAALDDTATPSARAALEARLTAAEADGDFIDVKKELTAGEQRSVFTNLVKTMHAGEKAELNPQQIGTTKILAYVIGWSFVDANGAPVPFSESALNNLDTESFAEITQAIDAHEEAIEKARDARKNARTIANT